jgi:integrase
VPKLTKTAVEALKTPLNGDLVVWDEQMPGFGVRVKPSGYKTYIVQYRNAQGRSRRMSLGAHGRITAAQAREDARILLTEATRGSDPAEQKARGREVPTISDICERYLTEYAEPQKKESSVYIDKLMIENNIKPKLGKRLVNDVSRADAIALHSGLKATPYHANRVNALFSKMMNLAERWGLRPDGSNPCRHVEKFPEKTRERKLTPDELKKLGETLEKVEKEEEELTSVIPAIRLILFTGCRRSEILTLRWSYVDIHNKCLRLPDSKTGAKVVPLNQPAIEVLESLKDNDPEWVIPGRKKNAHLVNLSKPWRRIREKAKLEDVRIHDLRHQFASTGVDIGEPLFLIGQGMGHHDSATTERYSHAGADSIRETSERIGQHLASALKGSP